MAKFIWIASLLVVTTVVVMVIRPSPLVSLKGEISIGQDIKEVERIVYAFKRSRKNISVDQNDGGMTVTHNDGWDLPQLVIKFSDEKVTDVYIKDSGSP